jgi:hypothetical protein
VPSAKRCVQPQLVEIIIDLLQQAVLLEYTMANASCPAVESGRKI